MRILLTVGALALSSMSDKELLQASVLVVELEKTIIPALRRFKIHTNFVLKCLDDASKNIELAIHFDRKYTKVSQANLTRLSKIIKINHYFGNISNGFFVNLEVMISAIQSRI